MTELLTFALFHAGGWAFIVAFIATLIIRFAGFFLTKNKDLKMADQYLGKQ